jgi:hypothetical protein
LHSELLHTDPAGRIAAARLLNRRTKKRASWCMISARYRFRPAAYFEDFGRRDGCVIPHCFSWKAIQDSPPSFLLRGRLYIWLCIPASSAALHWRTCRKVAHFVGRLKRKP